jgi:hypothetical protein
MNRSVYINKSLGIWTKLSSQFRANTPVLFILTFLITIFMLILSKTTKKKQWVELYISYTYYSWDIHIQYIFQLSYTYPIHIIWGVGSGECLFYIIPNYSWAIHILYIYPFSIFFLTTQNAFPHLGNSPPSIYYTYIITIFMLILSKITTKNKWEGSVYINKAGSVARGMIECFPPKNNITQ